jgi:hypothetical protein
MGNDNGGMKKIAFEDVSSPGGRKAKGMVIDTGSPEKDLLIAQQVLGMKPGSTLAGKKTIFRSICKAFVGCEQYIKKRNSKGSWQPKTAMEYGVLYDQQIKIIGNLLCLELFSTVTGNQRQSMYPFKLNRFRSAFSNLLKFDSNQSLFHTLLSEEINEIRDCPF